MIYNENLPKLSARAQRIIVDKMSPLRLIRIDPETFNGLSDDVRKHLAEERREKVPAQSGSKSRRELRA